MSALTNRYEDDDASHLPPGMKRVGYDTDTERYTFRQGDDLWLGEPGSFYGGQLRRAGRAPGATGDGSAPKRPGGPSFQSNSSMNSTDYYETITPPPEKHFHGPTRNPHSQHSYSGKGNDQGDRNLWGVSTVSISATGAEPPDGTPDNGSLKRRASKLIEVAEMTADAFGLHRWSNERATTRAAKQEKLIPSQERRRSSQGYSRNDGQGD